MTRKLCHDPLCPNRGAHFIYLQASPEHDAPRRETVGDFLLALGTWSLVALAYVTFVWAIWRTP